MRIFFLVLAFLVLTVLALAGLRGCKSPRPPIEIFSDMVRQPKVKALAPSGFFSDGKAARPPVGGTVPLGYAPPRHKPRDGSTGESESPYEQIHFSSSPSYMDTGRIGEFWGTGMPVPVDAALMERGRERFNIHCAVCHGATGAANGIATRLGLVTTADLLQPRLRTMADGEIFNTISHGKNTMTGLAGRILVPDRWAIIAYLRALQKSQGGATIRDVPPDERAKLEAQAP